VEQTLDEGYVAAGPSRLYEPESAGPWIAKTNREGAGMTECPEGLAIDITLTVEDTAFEVEPISAEVRNFDLAMIDFDMEPTAADVEVETLCEGE
jgi:hypothetical protein